MSKRQVLMIIGLLIIVVPYLGFPRGAVSIFVLLCGVLVAVIAYTMAPKARATASTDVPFSEYRSTRTDGQMNRSDSITKQTLPDQK